MRVAIALVLASACGDDIRLRSGDETLAVSSGGLDREVIVHAPASRPARAPLLLAMHCSSCTAAGFQQLMGLDALADARGMITAYPQGVLPYAGGFEWHLPGEPLNAGPAPADAPDDVAYVADAIAAIDARYDVDRDRIYAMGFSGGARMASQLGCDLDEIAAIAPISGLRYPGPCAARPESVIAFHGDADAINPYGGNGAPFWTYSVPDAIAGWAAQEGCAGEVDTMPAPTAVLATFPSCTGGALVRLYTLQGEGHQLPVAIDANTTMLAAFALVHR